MRYKPTESGPQFFYEGLDMEYGQPSGGMNPRKVNTPAAIANGLGLLTAAGAAAAVALLALFLYVTTSPLWIFSHSAILKVSIFNRNTDQPVSYVLIDPRNPDDRISSGILPADKSTLFFKNLDSGTTYQLTYYITEDGELKELDSFQFTTKGEGSTGAPQASQGSAVNLGHYGSVPGSNPTPRPTPTPGSTPPNNTPPNNIPPPNAPPYFIPRIDEDEDEDKDGGGGDIPAAQPLPNSYAQDPEIGDAYCATEGASSCVSYYLITTNHDFILADGLNYTALPDVITNGNPLPHDDEYDNFVSIETVSANPYTLRVTVKSASTIPGHTAKHIVKLPLSDGTTLTSTASITPPYISAANFTYTDDGGDHYTFTLSGAIENPDNEQMTYRLGIVPYYYAGGHLGGVLGFGPKTTSVQKESFSLSTDSLYMTTTDPQDAQAQVYLHWDRNQDPYEQAKTFNSSSLASISYSLRAPILLAPSPAAPQPEPAVPKVTVPDNISNVSANPDGSHTYTETHIFHNLPGNVLNISIDKNSSASSTGYQSVRSGDTLTVILEPQTLASGASATSKVSVFCSGQPQPLRSSLTITSEMLQAASG